MRESSVTVGGVTFAIRPISSRPVWDEVHGAILDFQARQREPGLGPSFGEIVEQIVRLATPDIADDLLGLITAQDFEAVVRAISKANES